MSLNYLFFPVRLMSIFGGLLLFWITNSMAAGLMTPVGQHQSQLEIKQHHVNVVIEDGYAITRVDQVFNNPHSQDLEAIYSFPIPEKAAVSEFTYWIDGKPVVAEVFEKQQAKQIYTEEKQAGREVGITEQDSYKNFDIRVYPVRANHEVRIRLSYIQPVHVDTAMGRYVYPLEEGGVDEQKASFWNYNESVQEQFSFNLKFRSSYPINGLRLPQHPQATIQQISAKEALVSMSSQNSGVILKGTGNGDETSGKSSIQAAVQPTSHQPVYRLDNDIVVYWRHQQGLPGGVDLVTHKPQQNGKGTFMLTFTPGDDLAEIKVGRDWMFVLDYSGSMQGKYQSLIDGVSQGLKKLPSQDRFRVILFNNKAQEVTPGYLPVNPQSIADTMKQLEAISPNNGTNLYAGMERALSKVESDRVSAVVLVTDGVANVGRTEKKDFIKLLKKADVRLFTFVMGNSANRPLLESMTEVSNGFAMSVSNSDDMLGRIMEAASKMNHQAYHDLAITFSGLKVRDVTPEQISSLYRGEQLIVFGHYWGGGESKVAVTAKVAGQNKTYQSTFQFPTQSQLNPEIERLWAYAKIEGLQNQMDYLGHDKDTEQAITDIAVQHGLVTEYTSMLVMREEQFKQRGIKRQNAARVANEEQAQQQRAAQPVREHKADKNSPMFKMPRVSHGGGSIDILSLFLLFPLIAHFILTKRGGIKPS